jgi:hypothetical protein
VQQISSPNSVEWRQPVDDQAASKRAGGRRHYNRVRQLRAHLRLGRIVRLLVKLKATGTEWGVRSEIARRLGVSRATVCRDMQRITRMDFGGPQYDSEWLVFYRYWRRTYGDCFGPRPCTKFPQMNRSKYH